MSIAKSSLLYSKGAINDGVVSFKALIEHTCVSNPKAPIKDSDPSSLKVNEYHWVRLAINEATNIPILPYNIIVMTESCFDSFFYNNCTHCC